MVKSGGFPGFGELVEWVNVAEVVVGEIIFSLENPI